MKRPLFIDLLQGRAPEGAIDKLVVYCELLERWAARHNLVKVSSRQELVTRHILESLTPIERLDETGKLVDIGSGAGLPGIPLLCAMDQWSGLLVEPRQKRWAFLSLVVRELGLRARVLRDRYETVDEIGFDLVTARAVGGHEDLLSWAAEHLAPEGVVALWATTEEAQRLSGFLGWSMVSSPLIGLERGRLIFFKVCST
ncbi:MAG: 16S rRNA (guanine(527)-N(7))-methyltransferase RsmG [Gammaproteobacteria bacterium]|nr:MAG: 16S rRNA (guanine(527)-N(7))-methyltransferase RsmG [Gammaproteobacteria bacterium]